MAVPYLARRRARTGKLMRRVVWIGLTCCFVLLVATGSEGAAAWLERGDRLAARKEYAAAISAYYRAAAWQPGAASPHLLAGRIYLRQRRFALARAELEAARRLAPTNADVLLALGDLEIAEGAPSAAVLWCRQAKAIAPERADISYALGMALLQTGELPDALESLRAAVSADAGHRAAHYALGLLLAAEDPDRAAAHLRLAAEERDDQVSADARAMLDSLAEIRQASSPAERSALLGVAYMRQRAWTLAREELRKALTAWPTNAELHAFLGYTLHQLGDSGSALQHLATARALDPESAQTYHFTAMIYRRLGWPHAALEMLAEAYRLDPRNPAVAAEIAQAYADAGAYDQAEAWFAEAAELAPEAPSYALLRAAFHVDHAYRLREVGIPAAEQAIALAPENPKGHELLGRACLLSGNLARAEESLRKALDLGPESAGAHYYLAEVMRQRGRNEEAISHYRRAIDLDTEGWFRSRAQQDIISLRR